mgnify:FL=1
MADLPVGNYAELEKIQAIASSANDTAVIMLNLNRYSAEAAFPNGDLYQEYMQVLNQLLAEVGGKVLWQSPSHANVIGEQIIHEALGIWYPSHAAFMNLMTAPSSERNMSLRARAVAQADLHRLADYTA